MADDAAKAMRSIAPARGCKSAVISEYAGVRACLISVPPVTNCSRKGFWSESGGPPSHENSNNPLAVEPETENDAARESCSADISRVINSIEAAASCESKRIYLKMFDTLTRFAAPCALLAALMLGSATPSSAQPTEAQKEAVKSACRSDYMAHCSSVQPGGEAALQCLAKNMSSLSAGCQSAVKAIEASAAPKSEPAKSEPAKTEAAPAAAPAAAPKTETTTAKPAAAPKSESKAAPAATAAKKPTDVQATAIRSACRGDYSKVCAGVPAGGAPALECLEKNKARVSAGCGKALAAVGGAAAGAPATAGAPAAAAPAAAPTVIVLRPMLPREELFVMRSACGGDIRTLCAGVAPGGGRIMQCISNRAADLSPACKQVLVPFMAR